MIEFKVTFEQLGDIFDGLTTSAMAQVVEAAARRHLNEMKRYELNAPGGRRRRTRSGRLGSVGRNPFPDRLRRITGRLADTAFIRPERQGLRQVIEFPAPYAAWHDGTFNPGSRDVFAGSFRRRGDEINREIVDGVFRLAGVS